MMEPHFHKWSKWSEPMQTFSGHKQQWRVCTICNKADFVTLPWDEQSGLDEVRRAFRNALLGEKGEG